MIGTRIAYMTGEYPRATDTFIQREVNALRKQGEFVQTLSIRRPPLRENAGLPQRAERVDTYYVLPFAFGAMLAAHSALFARAPRRYVRALTLALRTRAPGMRALLKQFAYFAEAGSVARHMQRCDLGHLHNHFSNSSCSVAMLAAELGGFPFSFTMHGPAEFFEPHLFRIDEKIRRAAFVRCISRFCRSQAMLFCSPEHWKKLEVIHCGVVPEEFERPTRRTAGRRLLFLGRLAAAKGLPVLLEAVAHLRNEFPDVHLTVAGDGPDRNNLEAVAKELGLSAHVRFLGYQSPAEVRSLLNEADIFVLASFAEGVPVVLMEAMAAGVPVVATAIAGIPELIEDGLSGLLVAPGDPFALSSKVAALLNDAELGSRLAAEGRIKVERHFNLAIEAEKLRSVFSASLPASEAVPARASRPRPRLIDILRHAQLRLVRLPR